MYLKLKEELGIMHNKILTIAIPTFNRSELLSRCLNFLHLQMGSIAYAVEILVFDNASTDETENVVQYYISLGLEITYHKNVENKGADYNIAQCYTKAKGKYVVAFGDDDVLYMPAIKIILDLISRYGDFGVLYLNWELIKDDNTHKLKSYDAFLYDDYASFCDKVSHNLTFISGNIVNAKYIEYAKFDKFEGTSLIQLALILEAAINAPYNICIHQPLIGVQPDNSGGYNVCKVFGENINEIFDHFNTNIKVNGAFNSIKRRLLLESFPHWIYRIKTKNHTFLDTDYLHKSLAPVYSKFFEYWLIVYPLIITNKFVIKSLWPVYKVYVKILGRVINYKSKRRQDYKKIKIQPNE